MDFWEKMRSGFESGVTSSKELFGKARERARDLGEKGIIRFEILQLENQVEKKVALLGQRTFEILVAEGQESVGRETPGLKGLLDEIEDLREKIQDRRNALSTFGE